MSEPLPEGHLSESEVAIILDAAQDAGAILIGGQSVAILGRRYREKFPELDKFDPLTSQDVDFYASPSKAKIVAARFKNASVYIPRPFDDATPNSAQVSTVIGGHHVLIDFMSQIIWVRDKNLQTRFLTLTGAHPDSGEELRILCLHPMDCLTNRLGNINVLRRRDEQAIRSASAAVIILDAFIDELLVEGWTKDAQSCLVDLEFVIRDRCVGHPSFVEFAIDPTFIMAKYAEDKRLDARFRELTLGKALARTRESIARKATLAREKFRR